MPRGTGGNRHIRAAEAGFEKGKIVGIHVVGRILVQIAGTRKGIGELAGRRVVQRPDGLAVGAAGADDRVIVAGQVVSKKKRVSVATLNRSRQLMTFSAGSMGT
jgi:hypothetical protein